MNFPARWLLIGSLGVAAVLSLPGCNGCSSKSKPAPKATEQTPAPTTDRAEAPKPEPTKAAVEKAPPKAPYLGPKSQSPDGYQLTMGLSDEKGTPRRQPIAMEANRFFVTVLDPQTRPVSSLRTVANQQLRAFLVARDLRQLLYAEAPAAIADGADARRLDFRPLEGGDHALIAAFETDDGKRHTISSPVVIKGALPEVMGPEVAGLTTVARLPTGTVTLDHADAIAEKPVKLSFSRRDLAGQPILSTASRFDPVIVYTSQMGSGSWLADSGDGTWTWTPPAAGNYLVLAALRTTDPKTGTPAPPRPVAFKLVVSPAAKEVQP